MKTRYFLLILFLIWSYGVQSQDKDTLSYTYKISTTSLGDSLSIAYADEGKGTQTLLFLHGLGSYLPAWQPNIDTLKNKYRCIALDLPGYGKSSKGNFDYSMSFFADVLSGFMENLEIDSATIVGHSMGGQIAMTFTLKYPEKVKKLILISPAGFETFDTDQIQLMESFNTAEQIKNIPDQKIKSNVEVNFYTMPQSAAFMITDRIKMKKEADFNEYTKAISKSITGMLEEPVFEQLSDIKSPTLIIFGKEDKLIPNKFFNAQFSTTQIAEMGQEKITGSQLHVIEKAGHMVHFEKAKEVNQLIMRFLTQ